MQCFYGLNFVYCRNKNDQRIVNVFIVEICWMVCNHNMVLFAKLSFTLLQFCLTDVLILELVHVQCALYIRVK